MKKRYFLSAICFLLLFALSVPAFAGGERAYNWYFMRSPDHKVPPCPGEFQKLLSHDAYFLDTSATPDDKVIYLTFDAGYENGNIAKILDTLAAHNVQGAFFILENLIVREPELVKRMQREGHAVCNHTATHKDMTGLSKAAFTKELTRLAEAYTALTGDTIAPFYRPPEGRFNESNLLWAKELGYKTVFWSFAYADWDNQKQPDATRALEKLTGHLHNGEVLLLHPTSSTNAEILGKFIEYAKSEGYRFDSLHALTAKAQNLPTVFPAPAHHGCLPLEYETA